MARSEARFQFGMWRAGLDGHGAHAKLLYAVLLTEATLNHCGVGAVRLSRWAKDASLTIAETEQALVELAGDDPLTAQVLIDDDTDEVFVRTLIRNDGVMDQPYVLKGALKEATRTQSPLMRWVLANELRKLPPRQPDGTARNGRKVVYPDPHAVADELWPIDQPPPGRGRRVEQRVEEASPEPDDLFGQNPFETLSSGFNAVHKTLRGSGGGGGSGGGYPSLVDGQVGRTAASKPTRTKPDTPNKIAQRLARTHYDRYPLVPFVAVMKLCKRALDSGYTEPAIADALVKLGQERRAVTADSLRIALDGPPIQQVPISNAERWQDLKQPTGTDGPPVFRALPGGGST